MNKEFSHIRSQLYKQALSEYPDTRHEDIEAMYKFLNPQPDENIIEVGAGSGFFSYEIAKNCKRLLVTDPSMEQLEGIEGANITVQESTPENIVSADEGKIDAIWSFGAMHHSFKKQDSFNNFYKLLKQGGRVIIGDVFSGTKLAQHFDTYVTKYCNTGHEVSFWSNEYVESIAEVAGFNEIKIIELPQKWWFDSEEDIAEFMYNLHAMTRTDKSEVLRGVKEILGVFESNNKKYIEWPMKIIALKK